MTFQPSPRSQAISVWLARTVDLNALEADPETRDEAVAKWLGEAPPAASIWRNSGGELAFDFAIADIVFEAHDPPPPPPFHIVGDQQLAAMRWCWGVRRAVAVAVGATPVRMPGGTWAFRLPWPANKSGEVVADAEILMSDPEHFALHGLQVVTL